MQILVCFAVKEERQFFRPRAGVPVLVTGMGQSNAVRTVADFLRSSTPDLVVTAGFAGGLNPAFQTGQVLAHDPGHALPKFADLAMGTFHCHHRVATGVEEKRTLWTSTGRDAVEMESGVIHDLCRERNLPCATVRVISDSAHEALPLDFNSLMTSDFRLDGWKLGWTLARQPFLIPELMRFQKRVGAAARNLGEVLGRVIEATSGLSR